MKRNTFLIIVFSLFLVITLALSTLCLAADCDCTTPTEAVKEVGGCSLRTLSGSCTNGSAIVEYSSAGLFCGSSVLIDNQPPLVQAREACGKLTGPNPAHPQGLYHVLQQIDYISSYTGLISVEIVSTASLGHHIPQVGIKRATFRTSGGPAVTLAQIFGPEEAGRIEAQARQAFDSHPMREQFQFDPNAFSVAPGLAGGIDVRFAFYSTAAMLVERPIEISVTTSARPLEADTVH